MSVNWTVFAIVFPLVLMIYLVGLPILLIKRVPDLTVVGIGFLVGGAGFFTLFSWTSLHDDFAGWSKARGTVLGLRDDTCGGTGCTNIDLMMSYVLAAGKEQRSWIRGVPDHVVWDAVDVAPNANGEKRFAGGHLVVLYDPKKPEHAVLEAVERQRGGLIAGLIFGGSFCPVGVAFLYRPVRNLLRQRRLERSGVRSQATILSIEQNKKRARRAGEYEPLFHPWIIKAEWVHPKTKAKHVIESGPIWGDPKELARVGGPIDLVVILSGSRSVYALESRPLGEAWTVKTLDAQSA
jgi:hypothetical protein